MKIKFVYVLSFVLAALLLPSLAHADGGTVLASYDASGTIVVTGPTGTTETLTFTFTLDQEYFGDPGSGAVLNAVPTPPVVTSSGPLGTFTFSQQIFSGVQGYGGFVNAQGDEIDLVLNPDIQIDNLTAPNALYADVYACISATCQQMLGLSAPFTAYGGAATETFTATPVNAPEPSPLALLAVGILVLPILKRLA